MPPRLHPATRALLARKFAAQGVAPGSVPGAAPSPPPAPASTTPSPPKPAMVQGTTAAPQGSFGFLADPPTVFKKPSPSKAPLPPAPVVTPKAPVIATAPDLTDVIVLDTETTGIGAHARLVEVAAVHVRNGVEVRRFQSLVNPEMHIPAMVVRVHGITDAMVAHSPTAATVLAAFAKFVAGHTLVAHNAGFDFGVLSREFARVKVAPPGCGMYCSVRLSRVIFPEAPRHGLGALTSFLKLSHQPAHRAVADCLTTIELLNAAAARKKSHQAVRLVGRRYEL